MRDLHRSDEREIWITRGHLWALAFMMVFIGVLAFFVGLLYGRTQAGAADNPPPSPALVDKEIQDDALDELLARLEALDAAEAQEGTLTYPGTLAEGAPPPLPAEIPVPTEAVKIPPARLPPEAPDLAAVPVATPGWAIQLASFPTVEEADALVAELAAQQVTAFRQAALVGGETRFRVRVGGYSSRDAAQAALDGLSAKLGNADAILVKVE